jgi:mRNA interferase RelE/StbE
VSAEAQWRLLITRDAERDFRNLPAVDQRRVRERLDALAATPPVQWHRFDIRRLTASDEWRLRVGDWRVRFRPDFDARLLAVLRVLPRGRAYRG